MQVKICMMPNMTAVHRARLITSKLHIPALQLCNTDFENPPFCTICT